MTRKINIQNYEEFFLDYLDGNLTEREIKEMENFLLEYPDLRKELEGMENIVLSRENIIFPFPEDLKQIDLSLPVTEDNFEFFCIAEMEGDITIEQQSAFSEYLKEHPDKKVERTIILKARIKADKNLTYPDKEKIKKSLFVVYRREMTAAAAVAAGIAILLSFWFSFLDQKPQISNLSSVDDKSKEIIEIADSASSVTSPDVKNEKKVPGEEGLLKNIEEKSRQAVKKAATTISFKAGIPVASHKEPEKSIESMGNTELNRDALLKSISIDPKMISNVIAVEPVPNDALNPIAGYMVKPAKSYEDPSEYLNLQEFAVQKLASLIFKEEKKEINAVNLASAGINKINEVAGTNMKLEASSKDESGEKVLSFNSRLISFSTPINRED